MFFYQLIQMLIISYHHRISYIGTFMLITVYHRAYTIIYNNQCNNDHWTFKGSSVRNNA